MGKFSQEKKVVLDFFDAMEKAAPEKALEVMKQYMAPEYSFQGAYPFREQNSIEAVAEKFWIPLKKALRPMQRRQDIFIAGNNEFNEDEVWVMSMGNFMGNFVEEWLGVRPNYKILNLRYSEFNCVKDGKIIKTGMFFDMIGFMQSAGCNPMPPQLGTMYVYPGPRDHNGLLFDDAPEEESKKTLTLLKRFLSGYPDYDAVMDCMPHDYLARDWHEDMLWYGSGGAGFTIDVFREFQKDFRRNLSDRSSVGHTVRFAEGNFACFFGWPNIVSTPIGGYCGYPGSNKPVYMQVVDVYYRKNEKLSENWVFPDVPYWLSQQNVDVFTRNACRYEQKAERLK